MKFDTLVCAQRLEQMYGIDGLTTVCLPLDANYKDKSLFPHNTELTGVSTLLKEKHTICANNRKGFEFNGLTCLKFSAITVNNLTGNNFTFEFFIKISAYPAANQGIFCRRAYYSSSYTHSGTYMYITATGKITATFFTSYSASVSLTSSIAIPIDKPVHVEIYRQSANVYMMFDGVQVATVVISSSVLYEPVAAIMYVGSLTTDNAAGIPTDFFVGILSSFRITKVIGGLPRHIAAFIPPKRPFTKIPALAEYRKNNCIAHFDGIYQSTVSSPRAFTTTLLNHAISDEWGQYSNPFTATVVSYAMESYIKSAANNITSSALTLDLSKGFTIELDLRVNSIADTNSVYLSSLFSGGTVAANEFLLLFVNGVTPKTIRLYSAAAGMLAGLTVDTGVLLTLAVMHTFVVRYDGNTTITILLDNIVIYSGIIAHRSDIVSVIHRFNRISTNVNTLIGNIYSLRINNGVLSDSMLRLNREISLLRFLR